MKGFLHILKISTMVLLYGLASMQYHILHQTGNKQSEGVSQQLFLNEAGPALQFFHTPGGSENPLWGVLKISSIRHIPFVPVSQLLKQWQVWLRSFLFCYSNNYRSWQLSLPPTLIISPFHHFF